MERKELENFSKTLRRLESFMAEPIRTDRDQAGVIQAFEFTFEQCWRALQKMAASAGGQVGNAKQAFTFAIQSGWIDRNDESTWIRMIEDRNLTSHTYHTELAKKVFGRIESFYLGLYQDLLRTLKSID